MNDKIYALIWEDTHSDTTVEVFSTLGGGIAYALQHINEYYKNILKHVEHKSPAPEWLFYANIEDCMSMWIVEKKIR